MYFCFYPRTLLPSSEDVVEADLLHPAWLLPNPIVEGLPAVVVQSASDMIVKSFHNPTLSPIPPHIVKAIQNDKYTDFRDLLPEALSEAFDKAQQEGKEETA